MMTNSLRILFLAAALLTTGRASSSLAAGNPAPLAPRPTSLSAASRSIAYGVTHVWRDGDSPDSDHPCAVKRGEKLWIRVWDLEKWLRDPQVKSQLPPQAEPANLVPFLQGLPLKGVHPNRSKSVEYYDDSAAPTEETRHTLRDYEFTLERSPASKSAWDDLLKRPQMKRAMEVSLGFENGEQINTWVVPTEADASPFYLQILPPGRVLSGGLLLLASLVIFLKLARSTDLIRDTTAPLRPDRQRPYSLARSQMAFWFFLVIISFFLLWVLTGATDTLTESVLGLVGISAGTALSSALVDINLPMKEVEPSQKAPVDLSKSRPVIVQEYQQLIKDRNVDLADLQRQKPTAVDPAANQKQQDVMLAQISEWERAADYFDQPPWKGLMYDLLSENNLISFHRFQIFVWTLVLGIIFVTSVYDALAMPDFNATLLGLLGISAGTYVGFKFPDRNAAASGQAGRTPP